jgi:uncharacterized OB-fold protein
MSLLAPSCAVAPTIDVASAGFWSALADGRLVVPRCNACGRHSFPPMPSCPRYGSRDVTPDEVSGVGTIYSWATVHIALSPAFEADVPYTVLVVDLREGGRLMGRFLEGDAPPEAGAEVRLAPYRVGEICLPGFRLAQAGDAPAQKLEP